VVSGVARECQRHDAAPNSPWCYLLIQRGIKPADQHVVEIVENGAWLVIATTLG
jgi:hypothetical protein